MTDTQAAQDERRTRDAALSALMRQAQAGDRVAYRQVLIGVTPYLRRAAGRFFARPADIDDAVQDILMTLHTVRHTYDPDRPFRPWLAGIARYRLVDLSTAKLGRVADDRAVVGVANLDALRGERLGRDRQCACTGENGRKDRASKIFQHFAKHLSPFCRRLQNEAALLDETG